MKKYKVKQSIALPELHTADNNKTWWEVEAVHSPGDVFTNYNDRMDKFFAQLEDRGFIEQLKNDEVWCRGVKITEKHPYYLDESTGTPIKLAIKDDEMANDHAKAGNLFNTEEEAEAYAEHLRIENELITIGVSDYGAVTTCSNESAADGVWLVNRPYNNGSWIVGYQTVQSLFFSLQSSRDDFERDNKELLDKYFAYFGEAFE
jgi:hypothetical protein